MKYIFEELNETDDYYDLLGVPKNASPEAIKAAFRQKAKLYHPDSKPSDADAEMKFKQISEAYGVLSDPEKRNHYDLFGPEDDQGSSKASGFNPHLYGTATRKYASH